MSKRLVVDSKLLQVVFERLCRQLIENHDNFENTVLLSIQPRGLVVGERIASTLESMLKKKVRIGIIDVTFHRDDFRRHPGPMKANETIIPFVIEGQRVVLIDDVLYSGRTVRAALDAMLAYGRPKDVELLTLIDRQHSRELPIEAAYIGRKVVCLEREKVVVSLHNQDRTKDAIWLVTK